MLIPVYTTRFEKDLKRMRKRGCDISKIKAAIILLINEKPLDARMKDHLLRVILKTGANAIWSRIGS